MNKITSNFSSFLIGLAILLAVASCGSSKQLAKLTSDKESVENSLKSCMTDKDQLMADLANSKKEVSDAQRKLNEREKELNAVREAVNAEKQKLQKMKKELIAAFADYDKNAVRIDERDGRLIVVMQNKILYESGKVKIDGQGLEAVQTISQVFKNNKGLNILVESHTDDTPINNKNFRDNWDLSVARSVAVVRLLEKYGVNPTRMTAAGRGEFVPVSQIAADNTETRAKNRRTEFIISPKMQGLYKTKVFHSFDEASILETIKIEAQSDPDYLSCIYAIQLNDGTKGVFIDATGGYSELDILKTKR